MEPSRILYFRIILILVLLSSSTSFGMIFKSKQTGEDIVILKRLGKSVNQECAMNLQNCLDKYSIENSESKLDLKKCKKLKGKVYKLTGPYEAIHNFCKINGFLMK